MSIFASFVHCLLNIFTYMATRRAFTWCDCRWHWRYFKVIRLFHIEFLKNGAWYGKSYYRPLIGNHTLAFDWYHFWWPWSTFEGHFGLGCNFHVHFSNHWQALVSRGLPAIAELLVIGCGCVFCVCFFYNFVRKIYSTKTSTEADIEHGLGFTQPNEANQTYDNSNSKLFTACYVSCFLFYAVNLSV